MLDILELKIKKKDQTNDSKNYVENYNKNVLIFKKHSEKNTSKIELKDNQNKK